MGHHLWLLLCLRLKFKFSPMFTNIFSHMCTYACVYSYACGGHWSTSSIVLQETVTLFLQDEVSHWVVELTCWLRWLFNKPQRSSISTSPRITTSRYLFFTFMWVFMIKRRSSCLYAKYLTYWGISPTLTKIYFKKEKNSLCRVEVYRMLMMGEIVFPREDHPIWLSSTKWPALKTHWSDLTRNIPHRPICVNV